LPHRFLGNIVTLACRCVRVYV